MGYYDLPLPGQLSFGFETWQPGARGRPVGVREDMWAIGLPHQCDDWAIAAGDDHAAVIAEAERFRDELGMAIERLRALPPG